MRLQRFERLTRSYEAWTTSGGAVLAEMEEGSVGEEGIHERACPTIAVA